MTIVDSLELPMGLYLLVLYKHHLGGYFFLIIVYDLLADITNQADNNEIGSRKHRKQVNQESTVARSSNHLKRISFNLRTK